MSLSRGQQFNTYSQRLEKAASRFTNTIVLKFLDNKEYRALVRREEAALTSLRTTYLTARIELTKKLAAEDLKHGYCDAFACFLVVRCNYLSLNAGLLPERYPLTSLKFRTQGGVPVIDIKRDETSSDFYRFAFNRQSRQYESTGTGKATIESITPLPPSTSLRMLAARVLARNFSSIDKRGREYLETVVNTLATPEQVVKVKKRKRVPEDEKGSAKKKAIRIDNVSQ